MTFRRWRPISGSSAMFTRRYLTLGHVCLALNSAQSGLVISESRSDLETARRKPDTKTVWITGCPHIVASSSSTVAGVDWEEVLRLCQPRQISAVDRTMAQIQCFPRSLAQVSATCQAELQTID
ncbi:hypothetical protein RRG08_032551 [Elysia crispata]|uniref:Uncharacterized protein n=1 Tax=Elysia crispata TaxID=231223 RepID=A0AAE1DPY5_9GAST|nr:hypothetical protein RRG08_032551 [Elysia crispata]